MRTADASIGAGFIVAVFGVSLIMGVISLPPLATATTGVTVYSPVVVTASATPSSGNYPLSVSLSSYTTGGSGTGYTDSWTDGAGHTSTLAVWTTTYTSAGTFTATVTVTDSVGNKGSGSVTVTVGSPLILSCSASPTIVLIGQSVTISCSMGGGTSYYGWTATYGDGGPGNQALTTASSYSFTHSYSSAGSFTVTVTGSAGLTSTGTCLSACLSVVSSFSLGSAANSATTGFTPSQYVGLASLLGGVILMAVGIKEKEEE